MIYATELADFFFPKWDYNLLVIYASELPDRWFNEFPIREEDFFSIFIVSVMKL